MKIVLLIVAVAFAAFLLVPESVNTTVWDSLKANRANCHQQIELMTKMGLIQDVRPSADGKSTRVTVNERVWNGAEHRWKVASGLYSYCVHAPDDGRHTAYVYGNQSGKILGSVANGNWFSN